MSKFFLKLANDETPNEEEWNDHLIDAHKAAPSMTPNAFAGYHTREGLNSYDILARSLSGAETHVVDLACGDGHLIPKLLTRLGPGVRVSGVDMSEGELAVARKHVQDSRVSFALAKAQRLPFADASVDQMLCHMAFMLMLPVEPVVREIARVLKPTGRFSAVVGSRNASGVLAEIQKAAMGFVFARYPQIQQAKSGDSRTSTLEGLQQLFNQNTGFRPPDKLSQIELHAQVDAHGVWDLMKDMYFIGMLPDKEKAQLRTELMALAGRKSGEGGQIDILFPMNLFSTVKLP